MKKIIYIVLNLFLFLGFVFPESYPIFSSSLSYNQVHDYRTGINVEKLDDYENLHNKNKVKKLVVNVIRDDRQDYFEKHYNNGFLVRDISHVHEYSDDILKYDEKGYLLKKGDNFSYNYLSDTERDYFYCGKKRKNEKIFCENKTVTIKTQNFTTLLSTGEIIKDGYVIEKFYYNDENLICYEGENWNWKGVKSEFVKNLNFYYDEKNRLIKITSGYKDDIRTITFISYDGNENIDELKVFGQNNELYYSVKFYNYDKYGNWKKQENLVNGEVTKTVIREIFYN